MKTILRALFYICACALCQATIAGISVAAPADERGPLEANSNFYAALNGVFKGDAAAMEQVWSHKDDVSYMGPDGLRHLGWDAVRADWNLLASKRLGGKVEVGQVRVQPGETMSAISGIEVGENIVEGKPQKISIRATNIFRKEDGKWVMIAHHTDKLPFLDK